MLVLRDDEIAMLKDANSLQLLDLRKWEAEHEHWLDQLKALEEELQLAQKTQAILDEQKQENMMLKETIDRLRFEMDELRTLNASGLIGSGGASGKSTLSKSLGAELLKMKDTVKSPPPEKNEEAGEEDEEDEDTEDEDVIQTIITRTKRVSAKDTVTSSYPDSVIEGQQSRQEDRNCSGRRGQGVLRC